MIIATILTAWTQDTDGVFTPKLLIDHPLPAGSSCVDITSQNPPHTPNLYLIEIRTDDGAYIDAIEQDTAYNVLTIDEEAEGSAV